MTKAYVFTGQRVAQRTVAGGLDEVVYLHSDHLGSASLTTDAQGDLLAEMRYYPYGATRRGTMPTDRRFTGQREAVGLGGLYDYDARYYDVATGRFVSADTVVPDFSNPQSLNRYAYTYNNPLRYTDPTGHYTEDEIMDAFGVETWEEVYTFFQVDDSLLKNRWGWLEVLRRAQDGDYIYGDTWDIEQLPNPFMSGMIHRNAAGQILVGDMAHDLFANHQESYMLMSKESGLWGTEYSKLHLRWAFVRYPTESVDLVTAGIDILSIAVEGALTPEGMALQMGIDAFGKYGAIESWKRLTNPRMNAGYSSDDALGLLGAVPAGGIIWDTCDALSHLTGWRLRRRP